MKVLALSSLYPPEHLGGYELACKQIMDRLRARGHEIHILTSKGSSSVMPAPPADWWIHRALDFAPLSRTQVESIWGRAMREKRNNRACRYWADQIRPDIINIWDMWGLLPSLLTTLERTGLPIAYAISSPWLIDYAETPHRWQSFWEPGLSTGGRRLVKRLLNVTLRLLADQTAPTLSPKPKLDNAFFVSRALRDEHIKAGWECQNVPIIYHGVDVEQFAPRHETPEVIGGRLLVSGRVVPEKGFHTAIEALAMLVDQHAVQGMTLDIVGPHPEPIYVQSLRQMVDRHQLNSVVAFHQQVPRETMPDVYDSHDILLFPSTWEEPFALTLLEAMACGIPVIGTLAGGTKEILTHDVTGLVFAPGDAASLAGQINRLQTEPGLGRALARRARSTVQQDFTIERAVERTEVFLANAAEKQVPPPS